MEMPDTVAGIDLLDVNTHIKVKLDRKIRTISIKVTMQDGEDSSYFTETDFEVALPDPS